MTSSPTPEPRKCRWGAWLRFYLLLTVTSLLGAAFCVSSFGARTYRWQAFEVEARLQPAWPGQTRMLFPPLGEVRATTHHTPVVLSLSLQSLSLDKITKMALHPPPRAALERDFAQAARRDLRDFVSHEILWGMVGGLLAPLLLRIRRLRGWAFSGLIGGGATALLLLATWHSFNRHGFDTLTYTGSLRQAGAVIALSREALGKADALSDKLRLVAGNLNTLYGRINAVSGPVAPGDTVRILHISDIHNNAAAVDFVRELTEKFDVQAVIDTGDLTDYGTPVEARLTSGLARLPVPHVFLAGNHDSQATVNGLRAFANTRILDGPPIQVAGLTILGSPDPSSARAGLGSVDTSSEALTAAGTALAAQVRALPSPPDMVCVHNPQQADPVVGLVPLVLCGHLHQISVVSKGATVICNAGTTGGAGTRYLDRREGVPLSAAILTFTRAPHPRLLFIDEVVLNGSLSEYSITRHTYPTPAPIPPNPIAVPVQ